MPKRSEVYSAIDGELEYQNRLFSGTLSGGVMIESEKQVRSVDEYALYLQHQQNTLVSIAGTSSDDSKKLEVVRKIAALCVACMEQHGAPLRT